MSKKKAIKAGFYLERTTRIVKLGFTQIFKNLNVDLTPEQWVIVDNLYQHKELSQVELAKNSFKNAPTISRIIDLLEKKKLVVRKKEGEDRRRYKVSLTSQGESLYKKVLPEVNKIRKQSWENLSLDDYNEFLRILNQVFDNFK